MHCTVKWIKKSHNNSVLSTVILEILILDANDLTLVAAHVRGMIQNNVEFCRSFYTYHFNVYEIT